MSTLAKSAGWGRRAGVPVLFFSKGTDITNQFQQATGEVKDHDLKDLQCREGPDLQEHNFLET